jgi:Asp/Glu/hydantoin racemase
VKVARIALIHAVPMAIAPVAAAFEALWPEAERINLLDDSLSVDRQRAGALTPAIAARIAALAEYARGCGANGILYTCSAFGAAIEAVARVAAIPVLKPNEAMFDEALATGKRIGMLATFPPSVAGMEAEFRAQAGARGATIATVCVPDAMGAAQRGDMTTHNALLAEAARRPDLRGFDALMLAQFSMAPARDAVQAVVRCPVLTSPASAVRKLKRLLL